MYFGVRETVGGFLCGEVSSALQKAIRRGDERGALFWATELDLSGYGNYVWKRLRVISSEDVGLAETTLAAELRALEEAWRIVKKDEGGKHPPSDSAGGTHLVHAVLLLVRARKSRIVDNACVVFYQVDRRKLGMQIPDYAVDHHTARGRSLGRTEATVGHESYHLENCTLEDPYLEESAKLDGWSTARTPDDLRAGVIVSELEPPARPKRPRRSAAR